MKSVNYIRVSSVSQNIDVHLNGGGSENYIDKISGAVAFALRPAGGRLLREIKNGNIKTVYVSEISRLGRDTADVLQTLKTFERYGVQLYSRREGIHLLDENGNISALSKMILTIFASVSEMERERIAERTAEGRERAKALGLYLGRKIGAVESEEVFLNKHHKVVELLKSGRSVREVSKIKGMPSYPTVLKVRDCLEKTVVLKN